MVGRYTAGAMNLPFFPLRSYFEIDPPAFSLTIPASPAARAGQRYEITPTASGNVGTVSWSIASGSLPEGLSLDAGTGSITGTPAAWGTTAVVVRATDSWAADRVAEQPLTIEVAPVALSISTGTLAPGTYQTAYADLLRATGGTGKVAWSIASGALPNGLTLDAASGAVAGTPVDIGTFAFAVTATDANWAGETATHTVALTVVPPPFDFKRTARRSAACAVPKTARMGVRRWRGRRLRWGRGAEGGWRAMLLAP